MDTGTGTRKHQRQPMVSTIAPPKEAPQMAPKPYETLWTTWYIPRRRKGIKSELIIVAINLLEWPTQVDLSLNLPIVIKPPPPTPASARMRFKKTTSRAIAQPKQPRRKQKVAVKKQGRRPNRPEKRPYSGWKAVLVIKYEVVNHDAVLAALNSELMTAYVDAVIVPSNPDRNTLDMMAMDD